MKESSLHFHAGRRNSENARSFETDSEACAYVRYSPELMTWMCRETVCHPYPWRFETAKQTETVMEFPIQFDDYLVDDITPVQSSHTMRNIVVSVIGTLTTIASVALAANIF